MNIFICWSGERGERLAGALQTHLPKLIPGFAAPPENRLFVSGDIEKGSRWFDAVEAELERADAGLVCITREALLSGWIHFEAGVLARAVRKKNARTKRPAATLYTYLLGVEPAELKGPLAEFQSTRFDSEDTKRLCVAISASMARGAVARGDWEESFDRAWGGFKKDVDAIGPLAASKLMPGLEDIFMRKTFNEPLDECTRQAWIDRFTGVRETIASLKGHRASVTADGTYILDLYNDLISQLDGYAMNMGALLLKETRFEVDPESGRLIIGTGIKRACESRRASIRAIVTHLLSPNCAPVLEKQSRQYAKLPSFEAKKAMLIHPAERTLRDGKRDDGLSEEQFTKCAESLWEFDRIYFYLVQENSDRPDVDLLIRCVEQELEKAVAVEGTAGLIPLHYAVRALKSAVQRRSSVPGDDRSLTVCSLLIANIEDFVKSHGLDRGQQLRKNLLELESVVQAKSASASRPSGDEAGDPIR